MPSPRPPQRAPLLAASLVLSGCGASDPYSVGPDPNANGEPWIRPVALSTRDQPTESASLAEEVYKAVGARVVQETGLALRRAAAALHETPRSCAELGAHAEAVLVTIEEETAEAFPPNEKLQVLIPCADPANQATGIARVGGRVAVVFAHGGVTGGEGKMRFLTTVAAHELGHALGLVHNSVGENCMGAWELSEVASSLLGSGGATRCVLLPHQRAQIQERSGAWIEPTTGGALAEAGPLVLAQPSRAGSRWIVELVWTGSPPMAAVGWHIARDGVRIAQVPIFDPPAYVDEDGEREYHEDFEMEDPGLVSGRRYCYSVAYHDAQGREGPPGPEYCVDLLPIP